MNGGWCQDGVIGLTAIRGHAIFLISFFFFSFGMSETVLLWANMVLAILLIAAVLLQQKGSGLGAAFGGSSNIYTTKRGIDKALFRLTIILSILFFGAGLIGVAI
jgi:preprotein translocase subunit SecG